MEKYDGRYVRTFLCFNRSFVMGSVAGFGANTVNRLPVYILNALYLAPITLWTYLNYVGP